MEDISHLLQREIFEMWKKLKHAEVKTEDSAVEKLDVKNENEKQEEIKRKPSLDEQCLPGPCHEKEEID